MHPNRILAAWIVFLASLSQATAGSNPINVGNFVWNDINSDGIQDANEPGLPGVTVQLWDDPRSQVFGTTVTGPNGNYTLQAPGPGNYRVRVVLPGLSDAFSPLNAAPLDTSDSDIIPSGLLVGFTDTYIFAPNLISITSIDAGIVRTPIPLGDRVWNDYDADGIQDPAEPGIAGATVELWNAERTLMLRSTTTNASGIYVLNAPGIGNYRIRVVKSSADSYAPSDAGASDALDSDVNATGTDAGYTPILAVDAATASIDAGIVRAPINVGNFIWVDADGDGVQDAGEPGYAGVTVQLWDDLRTIVLDQTHTFGNGQYTLQAPGPGNYRVRVLLPSVADSFAAKDAPPSDLTDSDINPSGSLLGYTDPYTFAPGVISITSIDGGVISAVLFRSGFE